MGVALKVDWMLMAKASGCAMALRATTSPVEHGRLACQLALLRHV